MGKIWSRLSAHQRAQLARLVRLTGTAAVSSGLLAALVHGASRDVLVGLAVATVETVWRQLNPALPVVKDPQNTKAL